MIKQKQKKETKGNNLDSGGVQHHTDHLGDGAGGEVVSELCADNAGVAVGTGDLAPEDSLLVAGLVSLLGPVDVSDTLADVELGVLPGLDTLDSEEGGACVLVSLASLVAEEDSTSVESGHFCCVCRNESG